MGPETIYDVVWTQVNSGAAIRYNTAGCLPAGAGAMYWYLVRARNSCGVGTYGTSPEDENIIACYYNPPVAP